MIQGLLVNSATQNFQISGGVVAVAASKLFTYPTRLANAWHAQSLTIEQSAYQFERRSIEITAQPDSTRSHQTHSNPYHRFYKTFAAPIQCDDDYIFDTRYLADRNIAQILGGIAVKALMARSAFPVTLIVWEKPHSLAIEVYELLGFPIIYTNRAVEGKLVTVSPQCQTEDFEPFYRSTFSELAFEGYRSDTPERVFIARRGSRSLINEAEIEHLLQRSGFQKVYFEDLPMHEQWSIARNAKIVVGVHDAALKNLVFNAQGVKLIELFHPGYVVDQYRRDIAVMGGVWCGVTGQLSDDIIRKLDIEADVRSFATARSMIDPGSLKLALNYLDIN